MDFRLKKPKATISEESAQAQILALLDHYQIDVETFESDQRGPLETSLRKLAGFVMQGLVEIQAPKVIQHLRTPPGAVPTVEYGEVNGNNTVAMDGKGQKDSYARSFALLGSVSGLGEDAIRALKGIDLVVAETIGVVFLFR